MAFGGVGMLASALARAQRRGTEGRERVQELDDNERAYQDSQLQRELVRRQQQMQSEELNAYRQSQIQLQQEAQEMRRRQAEADAKAQGVAAQQRAQEREQDRAFRAEEAEKQRQFMGSQNAATRALASQRQAAGPPLKPVPNAVASGYLGNQKQIQTIDQTIRDIEANPGALGAKALIPDMILNRLPGKTGQGGVMARAGVGDVGSLIIHDRTGATMAVAEARRLQPFIPSPTDDHKTALTKLRRLRALLSEETDALQDFYTPEQGYRGLGGGSRGAQQSQQPPQGYRPNNPFAR
jgi:hypothetical protein